MTVIGEEHSYCRERECEVERDCNTRNKTDGQSR